MKYDLLNARTQAGLLALGRRLITFGLVTLSLLGILIFQLRYALLPLEFDPKILGFNDVVVLSLTFYSVLLLSLVLSWSKPLRLLLPFTLAYPLYFSLARTIYHAYWLNNSDFKPKDIVANKVYQLHTLWLLLAIVGLSLCFRYFLSTTFKQRLGFYVDYALAGLIAVIFMTDSRLLIAMKPVLSKILDDGGSFNRLLSQVFLPYYFLFIILAYALIKALIGLSRNQANWGLALVSSLVAAVVVNFYIQQAYTGEGSYYGYFIVPGAITFQITFFTLLFFLIYLILNRYLLSTLVIVHFSIVICVANSMKMAMRAEPLLITDFVWVKELSFLASFIDNSLLDLILSIIFLVWLTYFFCRRFVLKGKLIKHSVLRVLVLLVFWAGINQVAQVFKAERQLKLVEDVPIISQLNNELDLNWLGFTMTARYKSLAFVWTKQLTKPIMDKPVDYNEKTMSALYEHYTKEAEAINASRPNKISNQTLIFILSESFANPLHVPGVTLSEPAIPNVSAIKEVTTSGLMTSGFYGGGTANLEFQTLTGLPFENFSPSVSIAYTEVVPKMAYLPSISQQFEPEHRLAIHPYGANNYNRSGIYKRLAFDRFLAKSESKDSLENLEQLGVYSSDRSLYDNVLKQLDPKNHQFLSVITMQNHAPWVMPEPASLVAKGEGFSETENANLTDYSRLLSYTDKATKDFLDQLSGLEQDVTVVFYGDHLPGLYPAKAFESKPESQYQTDYFIWNNKQPNRKLNYPLVGASDFIAGLLEHTESKVTPYQALLTKYLQEVSSQPGELTPEQEEIREHLRLLQYDLTVGQDYLLQHPDFFEMKE